MRAFNQWVKDNAATTTPPMELLDTTGHTVADSAAAVRAAAAAEHGVLVRAIGNTVAFAPPLISTAAELAEMTSRFEAAYRATLAQTLKG